MRKGNVEDVERLTEAQGKRSRGTTSTLGLSLCICAALIVGAGLVATALYFPSRASLLRLEEECRSLKNDMVVLKRDVSALKQDEDDLDIEAAGHVPVIWNAESKVEDTDGHRGLHEGWANGDSLSAPSDDVASFGREKRGAGRRPRGRKNEKKSSSSSVYHLEGALAGVLESAAKENRKTSEELNLGITDKCFKMSRKEHAIRTQTATDRTDFDNVIRCWQVPDWVDSSGYKYEHETGRLTVKTAGIYYIYSQILYVKYAKISEKFGQGIFLNDDKEAIFKCVTEQGESVHWNEKSSEYQTCYTGGVRFLDADDQLTLKNVYNRSGSGFMIMYPHLSYWGLFRVQDVPGVDHHKYTDEVKEVMADIKELKADVKKIKGGEDSVEEDEKSRPRNKGRHSRGKKKGPDRSRRKEKKEKNDSTKQH